jgi:hypothetical protein
MDAETARAIRELMFMIDNVNERNALGQLTINGVMVLLASARRQGNLSDVEVDLIDSIFADLADNPAVQHYEKAAALFETAKQFWEAARPR